jgi:iron complex transport system ATP-binding protein
MNSKKNIVHLVQASYAYGSTYSLTNINLSITPGELVALIGPNGSGKTTLIKLLSGYFKPTTGEVSLDGLPLSQWSQKSLSLTVAVVPQQVTVPFAFTGRQIALLGRLPHMGLSSATVADYLAVEDALELVGATDLAERTYNSLSSGERQKIIIAQALARNARLLLLDEPISHLDMKWQAQTLQHLSRIHASGSTIVTAIHDLNVAAIYFPRIVLISKGRIVADGIPRTVLTKQLLEEVYETEVTVHYPFDNECPQISLMPTHVSIKP